MKHMARTNDSTYAAHKAGYANAQGTGWKLAHNPKVVAATLAEAETFLREKAGAIGVMVLAELALDEKVTSSVRRLAAKDLATLSGIGIEDSGEKDLAEMTGQELNRAIAKAQARAAALEHAAAERARPILEGELVEAEDETEDNVFA